MFVKNKKISLKTRQNPRNSLIIIAREAKKERLNRLS